MRLPEYKSLDEKNHLFFKRETIDFKSKFDVMFSTLDKQNSCIFRGVSEAKYQIFTSMQREWLTKSLDKNSSFEKIVYSMLQGLRTDKTIIEYLRSIDAPYNDLLGLSLLQHYGAPSIMLDFTLDLRTALFFAFDDMKNNSTDMEIGDYVSLYVLVRNSFSQPCNVIDVLQDGMERGIEIVKNTTIPLETSLIENIDEYTMYYNPQNPSGGLSQFPIAYLGNPLVESTLVTYKRGEKLIWSNLNLIAQKGCFIIYNIHDIPLEQYCKQHAMQLICYDIHKSLAPYIKKKIGLTHGDIYPDLKQRAMKTYSTFIENL